MDLNVHTLYVFYLLVHFSENYHYHIYSVYIYTFQRAIPLAECSVCITTNQEVAGLTPGTSTILKMDYVWTVSTQSREDNWVAI